jgi:gamma-glutamylcyclotransferase (GGCT)/AIG2-like uncharacterized protein YtfP
MPMRNTLPCPPPAYRTTASHDDLRQRLFCYGTLQLPAVMEAVIGRRLRGGRAVLAGYGAFQVRCAEYPGLLRLPGQTAWGVLYDDLSLVELGALDRFEGAQYERRAHAVQRIDGRRVQAWVYMIAAGHYGQLTTVPWYLGRFRRSAYQRFMKRFVENRGFLYEP